MLSKICFVIGILVTILTYIIIRPITLILEILSRIFNAAEAAWTGFLYRIIVKSKGVADDEIVETSIDIVTRINGKRYNERVDIFNKISGL